MKRTLNRYIAILCLVFIAVSIRVLYVNYNPRVVFRPDTYGYYEISQQIFSDKFRTFIINERRMPLYPIFMQTVMLFTGHFQEDISSDRFLKGALLIILTQHVIGILSLIIIRKTLQLLNIKKTWVEIFTILMALNVLLFQWERELLTESLGIFLLMLSVYYLIKTLKSPKNSNIILLFIALILNFLNRPIYIALPFILFPIVILTHHKIETLLKNLIMSFIYVLLIMAIIYHNRSTFGYNGVTRTQDLALLGKILHYNIPVAPAKNNDYFYQNIIEYKKLDGDSNPFIFLEYFDHEIYNKNYLFNQLKAFNSNVILNNLPEFLSKSVQDFPRAMTETADVKPLNRNNPGFLDDLFRFIYFLYKNLQLITFIILPAVPISIYLFFKHKTFANAAWASLGLISLYQILFSVFLDYEDFGRLMVVAQPIFYLYSFYCLGKIYAHLRSGISP